MKLKPQEDPFQPAMPFSRSHENHPQLQLAQPTGRCKVTASPAGPPAEGPAAQGVGIPHPHPAERGRTNLPQARCPGPGQTPLAPGSAETPGRRLHPAPSAAAVSSPGQSAGSYGSEGAPVTPGRRALRKAWTWQAGAVNIGGTWRAKAAGRWKPGRSPLKKKKGVVRMGCWGSRPGVGVGGQDKKQPRSPLGARPRAARYLCGRSARRAGAERAQ